MNLASLPDRRAAAAPHASAVADDAIAEAAVVGRADPVYGEQPVLFASLNAGADLDIDRIREHLAASLSKYKLPVEITVLPELPKNAVGKIDKPSLRKSLATASARP